jgi:hypothetical protein
MSVMQDWEVKQLKRLISAILKKVGPVTITNYALNKASGEWRVDKDGYGTQMGFKYYVK